MKDTVYNFPSSPRWYLHIAWQEIFNLQCFKTEKIIGIFVLRNYLNDKLIFKMRQLAIILRAHITSTRAAAELYPKVDSSGPWCDGQPTDNIQYTWLWYCPILVTLWSSIFNAISHNPSCATFGLIPKACLRGACARWIKDPIYLLNWEKIKCAIKTRTQ